MTSQQVRYFSKHTKRHRVNQLVEQVNAHPRRAELLQLLQAQVRDDNYQTRKQYVYA